VVAAPNASDMQAAFGVLDRVADELGVEWKESKDEGADGDLQELEVWGLLLKTGLKGATLTIPEDKRARYWQNLEKVLRDLRTQGKSDFGESRSLVGQLAFSPATLSRQRHKASNRRESDNERRGTRGTCKF